MTSARSFGLAACALALGCAGTGFEQHDPQLPDGTGARSATAIVICPDGSTYDVSRNACVAQGSIQPAADEPPEAEPQPQGKVTVRVECKFPNGWVALLPEARYPEDDSFLMQALIGFAVEPNFWANEPEYRPLRDYAAQRCNSSGTTFEVDAGSYFVLAGEADTFSRRGQYYHNGYRGKRRVSAGAPVRVVLQSSDLTHTWLCISCPFVSLYDASTGRFLPSFVILPYRGSRQQRGTHRVKLESVPVQDGVVRLRVVEAERERTHLDELVLVVDGKRLLPMRGGANSALAQSDDAEVLLEQGTQIEVSYAVPGVKNATIAAELVATGYYEALAQ